MQVSHPEFQSLLRSEEFGLYRAFLQKLREDIKNEWARGTFTHETESGTIQLNARQIGKVELLDKLLDPELSYEEIMEFLNDK
jgi:hypothetical protein